MIGNFQKRSTNSIASFGFNNSWSLNNWLFYAFDEHPIACRNSIDFDFIASIIDPNASNLAVPGIFFVLKRVVLAQNLNMLIALKRTAEHTSVHMESSGINRGIILGRVNYKRSIGITRQHWRDEILMVTFLFFVLIRIIFCGRLGHV